MPATTLRSKHVVTKAVKCNTSPMPIPYKGEFQFVQVKPYRIYVGNKVGSSIRYPGCKEYVYNNELPDGLTNGTWRIEGVDIAEDPITGKVQREIWYTQDFEVLP